MLPKCFVRAILNAAAIVSLLIATNQVALAGTLSISPDVPVLPVPEDEAEGLLYPFTATNNSAENDPFPNIVVRDVRLPVSGPAIEFIKGDRNDEVSSVMIVQGALNTCEVPVVLRPGDTCNFQQLIITQDLNKPASDNDSGTWQIFNVVDFFDMSGIVTFASGSGMVEVVDPAVPEPTTLPIFVFGIVLVAVIQIARSRRGKCAFNGASAQHGG